MSKSGLYKPLTVGLAFILCVLSLWYIVADLSYFNLPQHGNMGSVESPRRRFEAVTGFFEQGMPDTVAKDYDYMKHNFGLINRPYDTDQAGDDSLRQWQRFERYVHSLIEEPGVRYKVFYVGRHGEGFHNVAEAKYGTKAWDAHWAKLIGDGELYWLDAHLTNKGKQQALDNHAFLQKQFSEHGMPAPQKYFTSPLYRCVQTANLTYGGRNLPVDRPLRPLVKEMAREVMGVHTCDQRSSRTVIHSAFPDFPIEEGFSEEDELWQPDHRETWDEHDVRTLALLDDIFENIGEGDVFVSLTSHSGSIASLLRVLGHREFRLPTGGMIPLFVKATKEA